MTFDLILIGFGSVAQRFVGLLDEQRATLAREYGVAARIVGIATRRHGQVFSERGLNASKVRLNASTVRLKPHTTYGTTRVRLEPDTTYDRVRLKPDTTYDIRRLTRDGAGSASYVVSGFSRTDTLAFSRTVDETDTLAFLRKAIQKSHVAAGQRRLVVVETTTLDIVRGEPARGYIRAALAGGAHVITTNKGPVACAYRALRRAAERADRRWLFEGAVMDGVPIFNLAREALPAVKILGFRGVVNSTTNYMLTAMEQGRPFDEALREMQSRGVAEADASLDVDGWDAAAKTAALANVLLDGRLTPGAVEREGITRDTGALAVKAREAGRRLKLVARAARDGRRVTARVAPEVLAGDDLLAGLEGQQNALILRTDLLEEIAIVQRSGSLTQTAYALLSDLLAIARATTPAGATRRSQTRARRD